MGNEDGTGLVLVWMCTTMLGAPAILVLLTALTPSYVRRAREVMLKWPVRSFLLGLVNFLFFSALVVLTAIEFAPAQVVGVLSLLLCLPVLAIVGLLAAAGICGEKLWLQAASRPGTLLGSLIIGVLLLGLVLIVPFVGWAVVFALILAGLGASVIALVTAIAERVQRKQAPVDVLPADEAA
jgi:hypothetical protein